MSGNGSKKKLIGLWRNLHAAVWLIGLAILAWTGRWWPGILVLVAISMVVEGLLMQFAPQAFEKDEQVLTQSPLTTPPSPSTPSVPKHRLELLPSVCPNCGGPIRGHDVKWTGEQSADCPYCGMNLPMATNR